MESYAVGSGCQIINEIRPNETVAIIGPYHNQRDHRNDEKPQLPGAVKTVLFFRVTQRKEKP